MTKKALQDRVAELKAKTSLTADEETELLSKQQELDLLTSGANSACSHAKASLEDRYCPGCGEKMPALPRAAIEQIVDHVLSRRGSGNGPEPEFLKI